MALQEEEIGHVKTQSRRSQHIARPATKRLGDEGAKVTWHY